MFGTRSCRFPRAVAAPIWTSADFSVAETWRMKLGCSRCQVKLEHGLFIGLPHRIWLYVASIVFNFVIFVAGGYCEHPSEVWRWVSLTQDLEDCQKKHNQSQSALKVRFVTMSLMMTWTSCSRRCSEQGACLPKSKASLLNGFEENIDRLAPCAGRNWLQRHLSFDKKTIPHTCFAMHVWSILINMFRFFFGHHLHMMCHPTWWPLQCQVQLPQELIILTVCATCAAVQFSVARYERRCWYGMLWVSPTNPNKIQQSQVRMYLIWFDDIW